MTTYQLGWRFSYVTLTIALGLGIAAFFFPHQRYRLVLALVVPAIVHSVANLAVRCTQCDKSAFITEVFGPRNTLVGWITLRHRVVPERICSRCGADLTVQEA
ncbi:hypothetical protein [Sphingosinicella ginsenosidimutans]|uniref:Uncharacterized protein n=1 Tax=Allosphingosinicella ginsenosidimutans TaxID=1176539 RepID=A0A5C6TWG6_9SPHN|nr:hypothetical protein [Sphingosinicella ginsenosidimutans]TXC64687.1 hypothetical protein FRZ32_14140 [Sphingosinicella ginsenosidimutans]